MAIMVNASLLFCLVWSIIRIYILLKVIVFLIQLKVVVYYFDNLSVVIFEFSYIISFASRGQQGDW